MKTIPRLGGKSVIKDINPKFAMLAIVLLLRGPVSAHASFDVLHLLAHLFRLALDLHG